MNPIVAAVLKTGLLDKQVLSEMRRWGVDIDEPFNTPKRSPEEIAAVIEEALQSEGYVLTKETDLEALRQYLSTNRRGMLHVGLLRDDDMQEIDVEVSYGKTSLGDYIIGWRSEAIEDVMTNGVTYLIEDGHRVYFHAIRELFFGDVKAFMVCTPIGKASEPRLPEHGNDNK